MAFDITLTRVYVQKSEWTLRIKGSMYKQICWECLCEETVRGPGYDISKAETALSAAKISTQGCREVLSANIGPFRIVYTRRGGCLAL